VAGPYTDASMVFPVLSIDTMTSRGYRPDGIPLHGVALPIPGTTLKTL